MEDELRSALNAKTGEVKLVTQVQIAVIVTEKKNVEHGRNMLLEEYGRLEKELEKEQREEREKNENPCIKLTRM